MRRSFCCVTMRVVLLRDTEAAMKHIDNNLLNHAYECLFDFDINVDGVWKQDVLTIFPKDKKRAEILDWLVGVIDAANAPFIERSAAPIEKEMRKLFQENPLLRALYEGLVMASQFPVEFDVQELINRFQQDVNLFRDMEEWIYESLLPRVPHLRYDSRYWGKITALNDTRNTIDGWSEGLYFESEDTDAKVRMMKKAYFIVRWLCLFLEAGIEPSRISKKTFEQWRTKKQGGAGTHQ
ncbi:hypothetical protein KGQ34_00660 [Patescibacteria group bacterium]|nr:hypothetical protein [Patescibacteria group bacterium]